MRGFFLPMKTIVIHSAGGYEKLEIENAPKHKPQSDEVVIQTRASGINYADICVRWGIYESAKQLVGWPITPGFEFAGDVLEVGSEVTTFKAGDKVFGVSFFNGYSGCIKVKSKHVFKIPDGFSYEQMATFPAVYLTAYHGLLQNFVTFKSMNILIHSAAGGVGGALLQLCKAKGFNTVGIVGRSHKVEIAERFGADSVIDKSIREWATTAREYVTQGFDAVFDANGVSTIQDSFDLLRPTGKLVVYGFHSMLPKEGGKINWPKLAWNYLKTPKFSPLDLTTTNKSVMAFNLSFLFDRDDLFLSAMDDLIDLLKDGKISPHPVTTYPLVNAGDAHADLESGLTTGKLALIH